MNRRDFFGFLRTAPIALPALMLNGGTTPDGVHIDGKSFYLDGRKVMEQMPDGSIQLGPDGNIVLLGKQALLEVKGL
jgi:hypothetical protein